ncbi:hypothetical protein JW826_01700 [Candidatus Woesearchaeota archaeon]|nr:hypothetical protein [Candidatus Woesearchaeota archaeon]
MKDVDVLCPEGNEAALLVSAEKLGFKEVILLYEGFSKKEIDYSGKLKIRLAAFIRDMGDAGAAKKHHELVFAPAERPFFESRRIDYVIDAESASEGKDFFYQRRAGLDDPMCKLALEREITIVFGTGSVTDAIMLGRMVQNARLCRKHKNKTLIATLAKDVLGMRSAKDLEGFARTIKLR